MKNIDHRFFRCDLKLLEGSFLHAGTKTERVYSPFHNRPLIFVAGHTHRHRLNKTCLADGHEGDIIRGFGFADELADRLVQVLAGRHDLRPSLEP